MFSFAAIYYDTMPLPPRCWCAAFADAIKIITIPFFMMLIFRRWCWLRCWCCHGALLIILRADAISRVADADTRLLMLLPIISLPPFACLIRHFVHASITFLPCISWRWCQPFSAMMIRDASIIIDLRHCRHYAIADITPFDAYYRWCFHAGFFAITPFLIYFSSLSPLRHWFSPLRFRLFWWRCCRFSCRLFAAIIIFSWRQPLRQLTPMRHASCYAPPAMSPYSAAWWCRCLFAICRHADISRIYLRLTCSFMLLILRYTPLLMLPRRCLRHYQSRLILRCGAFFYIAAYADYAFAFASHFIREYATLPIFRHATFERCRCRHAAFDCYATLLPPLSPRHIAADSGFRRLRRHADYAAMLTLFRWDVFSCFRHTFTFSPFSSRRRRHLLHGAIYAILPPPADAMMLICRGHAADISPYCRHVDYFDAMRAGLPCRILPLLCRHAAIRHYAPRRVDADAATFTFVTSAISMACRHIRLHFDYASFLPFTPPRCRCFRWLRCRLHAHYVIAAPWCQVFRCHAPPCYAYAADTRYAMPLLMPSFYRHRLIGHHIDLVSLENIDCRRRRLPPLHYRPVVSAVSSRHHAVGHHAGLLWKRRHWLRRAIIAAMALLMLYYLRHLPPPLRHADAPFLLARCCHYARRFCYISYAAITFTTP